LPCTRKDDPGCVPGFILILRMYLRFASFEESDAFLASLHENKINGYEGKIKKNTGPITLNIEPFLDDIVIKKIFLKLKDHLGEFELNAGFFFQTDYPHIIHNDEHLS
jgi:hypothetical protein